MLRNNKFKVAALIVVTFLFLVGFFLYKPDLPITILKEKYANDESKFITLDETEIHYREEGIGEVILLIHGTAASLHTWDDWTSRLKKDYRVIRLDIPAYGLTGPFADGNYQTSHYTTLIEKFLVALKVDELIVGGNSLGGQIALDFTMKNQSKVRKLILLDPSGLPTNQDSPFIFQLAKNSVGGFLMKHILPKFIIRDNLEAVYYNDELITDKLVNRYYELALREGNRQAFIDRIKTNNAPFSADKLNALKVSTLILWGAQDQWIPVANASKFHEYIPNSEVVIFDNAGHVPMEEIPFQSLKELLAFIAN